MKINHDYHHNKNTSYGKNKDLFIIIHHTGGVGEGNIKILAGLNPKHKVSVQYLVMQDGRVYQFVDDDKIARHAGLSHYTLNGNYFKNFNHISIGIEIESDGHYFTDIQKKLVKELTKDLMKKYGIGIDNVLRHLDISGYRGKRDVGEDFRNKEYNSWEDYKKSLLVSYDNEMTEKQKKLFIKSIYENNSSGRDNIEAIKEEIKTANLSKELEKLQKQQAKVNEILREMELN